MSIRERMMIRPNPSGQLPAIHPTSYIDRAAVIIGNVTIGKNVFVAPGAVIRADEPGSSIYIGDTCNVQDRVIIHSLTDCAVTVSASTSLSHGCLIHGPCSIGQRCFVGFGSVVFNSFIAEDVFIGLLALVSGVSIAQGRIVKDGAVINTARKAKAVQYKTKGHDPFAQRVLLANLDLLKGYKGNDANV